VDVEGKSIDSCDRDLREHSEIHLDVCSYRVSPNLSLLQLPSSIELKEIAPIYKYVDSQPPLVAPQHLSNIFLTNNNVDSIFPTLGYRV
jgi:hypothetical protein